MSENSRIEWTDATWNPVRGCTKVSEGCRHCYAMQVAYRFSGPGQPYEGLAKKVGGQAQWTNRIDLAPEHLYDSLRWKTPRRIFVNSMSDLFHEDVPEDYIDKMAAVMALCPQHTFQVLTKRPERMRDYWAQPDLSERILQAQREIRQQVKGYPLVSLRIPNLWLGVSVEDQGTAKARIPPLLQTPAPVRFISYEPALESVDFTRILLNQKEDVWLNALTGQHFIGEAIGDTLRASRWKRLDWIIVGGESGPNARLFDLTWARQTVQQCREAGVPVFIKQLGSAPMLPYEEWIRSQEWQIVLPGTHNHTPGRYIKLAMSDKKGGDPSEWPEDLRVRQFPEGSAV